MFKFISEPGLEIQATQFKVRRREQRDDWGQLQTHELAYGRLDDTGVWYFVPEKEKTRLESLGVVFRIEQ